MTEVLTAQTDASEVNGGLSRRRVVAGVAWSLPVIVTAVAAPAAAASGTVTAALAGVGSTVTYLPSKGTGSGTNRTGTGPSALQLQNTGGAFEGLISGTISIIPVGTVAAGAGVQSITSAALVQPTPLFSAGQAYNGSFTYSANIPSGQTVSLPIQLQFQSVNPAPNGVLSYSLTITLTLPDRSTQVLTTGLTVTY